MIIRRAKIKDVPEVCDLYAMQCEEQKLAGRVGTYPERKYIERDLSLYITIPGEGLAVVAEDEEGKVVGVTSWRYFIDLGQTFLREEGWFVHPSARGQGIGFKLIVFLVEEAGKEGLSNALTIAAVIGHDHERLLGKLAKMGFAPFQIVSVMPMEKKK